ncbi:DUF5071 domain-containing protein [Alkaliphilus sp. MSJ-5]|uniref:DUF5071 domain-containing protein n=1 Tax=Alkaliphilus flagellatus TaxID=2841507 RepID=A0ABS6G589_9FIRM|nr:DUF5071 domain-containing protein [Alkaliphilus flagellatus]MBU5676877.1 DUF5071 domain-containing protein [Alkaliphilus flagellatus]
MKDIEKYIADLNWDNPDFIQQNAIRKLSEIEESKVILLAKQSELCNKSCWYNAAIVLKNIGYPRNKLAIPYLMNWFKDTNWPGVPIIVQLLKEIDVDVLMPHIKNVIEQASKEQDGLWAYGMIYLINELKIPKFKIEEENLYKELIELGYGE